ncbi:hypothetical protein V6U81_16865 [Micromonospora sp. CPCC 205711]|uniref:hypothetical protein n=1 Tax=Micromonospora sp. CPCC 205547 TaxID=3122400 RepID=UPI002FF35C4F
MEQPSGFILALDAVHRHVNSARPDAPVRPTRCVVTVSRRPGWPPPACCAASPM